MQATLVTLVSIPRSLASADPRSRGSRGLTSQSLSSTLLFLSRVERKEWANVLLFRAPFVETRARIDSSVPRSSRSWRRGDRRFAHSDRLVATGRPRVHLAEQLADALGWPAVVELVALVGFYCMVSFTLNAFDVELPEGVAPIWSRQVS